jgi:hypothetical protein
MDRQKVADRDLFQKERIMSIHFTCSCGKEYQVKDELAGKRAKCKRCGETIRVPRQDEDSPAASLFDDLDANAAPEGDPLRSSGSTTGRSANTANIPVIAAIVACASVVLLVAIVGAFALLGTDSPQPPDRLQTAESKEGKVGIMSSVQVDNSAATTTPPPPPPEQDDKIAANPLVVTVSTNARGAMIAVLEAGTENVVESHVLQGEETEHVFELSRDAKYQYRVRLGDEEVNVDNVENGRVALLFDETQLVEIWRLTTCLAKLPEGGHGSGFLLRDRKTIVTAAHVLGTKRVEDVEFIFDPGNNEEVYRDAQLIHFNAEDDVAILQLKEPVADRWPFLWPAAELPAASQVVVNTTTQRRTVTHRNTSVLVIGNPRHVDSYDALYTRNTTIRGYGPDVMQLGDEFKPGFSGGPVCVPASGKAIGLISYKLGVPEDYRIDGVTFAKSIRLVNDALRNWDRKSVDAQQREMTRLSNMFARRYGARCAAMASAHMFVDSAIYAKCCVSVANDFVAHIRPLELQQEAEFQSYQLRGYKKSRLNAIEKRMTREREAAVEEYRKTQGAERARKIREEVTADLEGGAEKWYAEAMADETLSESLKEHLEDAHECYTYLKQRAETIDTDERAKNTTLKQFVDEMNQKAKEASKAAANAITLAQQQLR